MGSLGQGAAGKLEAGTMLRSSLSSGGHVTCAGMPLGRLSCQVGRGMWEMAPVGSATVLYTLRPQICLQHWREYISESDLFRKDPKQLWHPIKVCCKAHCSLHILTHIPLRCSLLPPSLSDRSGICHSRRGGRGTISHGVHRVFMVHTCLPSSTPQMFWGSIFIAFSFCLEEV